MSLIGLIITLVVVGLLLWVINTQVPMQDTVKRILNVVVIIAVIIWLLTAFGVLQSINNVQVPRVH